MKKESYHILFAAFVFGLIVEDYASTSEADVAAAVLEEFGQYYIDKMEGLVETRMSELGIFELTDILVTDGNTQASTVEVQLQRAPTLAEFVVIRKQAKLFSSELKLPNTAKTKSTIALAKSYAFEIVPDVKVLTVTLMKKTIESSVANLGELR